MVLKQEKKLMEVVHNNQKFHKYIAQYQTFTLFMNLVYVVLTIMILDLKKYLFGTVTLTKIADTDKYKYSGYGIGFNRRSSFSFPSGGFGQNILFFGVDRVLLHTLIIRKKALTAEKMY